jgi:hypothetical protein
VKLLTLIYDSAIDGSLMSLFEELELASWTKFYHGEGKGLTGLKLNTPVWPGSNIQLIVVADEQAIQALVGHIHALQDEFKLRPGIFMYTQDVEEV